MITYEAIIPDEPDHVIKVTDEEGVIWCKHMNSGKWYIAQHPEYIDSTFQYGCTWKELVTQHGPLTVNEPEPTTENSEILIRLNAITERLDELDLHMVTVSDFLKK